MNFTSYPQIPPKSQKKGIRVELCRTVETARIENSTVQVSLGPSPFLLAESIPAQAKKPGVLEADWLFMTIGRVPNTS